MKTAAVVIAALLVSCHSRTTAAVGNQPHGRSHAAEVAASDISQTAMAAALKERPWCADPCDKSPISLHATFTKKIFRVEEPIPVILRFSNTSETAVTLATPLVFGWTLRLWVEDRERMLPMEGTIAGMVPGEPKVLEPGESFAMDFDLLNLPSHQFPRGIGPGEFRLKVCYEDPRAYRPKSKHTMWVESATTCEIPFEVR